MLFITTTFWLLSIVFVAYGIFEVWSGMVRPRIINLVLLPGTIAVLVLNWEAEAFIGLGRQSILNALGHSAWLMAIAFVEV